MRDNMECIVNFFERVYGIKMDPESKYGYIILNKNLNERGRKEVSDTRINDHSINNSSLEDVIQDAFDKMGIKDRGTREDKVDKVNIRVRYLPHPEKGESVNLKFLAGPKIKGKNLIVRCNIFGYEDEIFDLILTKTMYREILLELKKARIAIDEDLKCLEGHIFTIYGKEWDRAPREIWKIDISGRPIPPKIFGAALRLDLEARSMGRNCDRTLKF